MFLFFPIYQASSIVCSLEGTHCHSTSHHLSFSSFQLNIANSLLQNEIISQSSAKAISKMSAVRTILAGVSVLNAVAAIEFYLMDAPFLLAFGIDAARATPQVQFLCASLSSLYAAQAALLFCAAVMLDMHGRRAVGWATCGANLLLAENVLRLREMFHASNHAAVDASRLSLGLALVVHVACAIALVAAVLLDLNSGGAGSPSGQSVSFDVPDNAPAGAKFDPNAPLPPATAPDGKPTGVDWRTFKATTFPGDANPAAGANASSSSSSNTKKNK